MYRLLTNHKYIDLLREEVDVVIIEREEGWTKAEDVQDLSLLREDQRRRFSYPFISLRPLTLSIVTQINSTVCLLDWADTHGRRFCLRF